MTEATEHALTQRGGQVQREQGQKCGDDYLDSPVESSLLLGWDQFCLLVCFGKVFKHIIFS